MNKFSKEDLEKMLNNIYKSDKVQQERRFSLVMGLEGSKQLQKAFEYEIIMTQLDLSKFNDNQKENIKKLLNSGLDSDFYLAKEILNVK